MNCRLCKCEILPGKITCRECGAVQYGNPESMQTAHNDDGIIPLSKFEHVKVPRYRTGLADEVFGPADDPGLAVCSVTVIGAAPGFGKSTLCLQLLSLLAAKTKRPGLFIGAEESGGQTRGVAHRLQLPNLDDVLILPLEKLSAGHTLSKKAYEKYNPCAVVIDSIQAFSGRDEEVALATVKAVKIVSALRNCPHIFVGQMTKEEAIAGSNAVLHQVDTLMIGSVVDELEVDGDVYYPPEQKDGRIEPFRILSTLESRKNRFGSLNECYFTMGAKGLVPFNTKGK
jgi:DNA repair protein RadA/Sms